MSFLYRSPSRGKTISPERRNPGHEIVRGTRHSVRIMFFVFLDLLPSSSSCPPHELSNKRKTQLAATALTGILSLLLDFLNPLPASTSSRPYGRPACANDEGTRRARSKTQCTAEGMRGKTREKNTNILRRSRKFPRRPPRRQRFNTPPQAIPPLPSERERALDMSVTSQTVERERALDMSVTSQTSQAQREALSMYTIEGGPTYF